MNLTVSEALALSQERRGRWFLLGFDFSQPGQPGAPIYDCPCGRQRYTVRTIGAVLPDVCPQCNENIRQPLEGYPRPANRSEIYSCVGR